MVGEASHSMIGGIRYEKHQLKFRQRRETNILKNLFKEYGLLFLISFVASFIVGFFIGILLLNYKNQEVRIAELEEQKNEMYQELIITKDQLTQIQMRNEAIKYIDELEE